MSLLMQQRSVIRYFVLCQKSNQQIGAKLAKGYGEDALCLRALQKWAVRFCAGKENVEHDERSGRPPQTDIRDDECDVRFRKHLCDDGKFSFFRGVTCRVMSNARLSIIDT
jgi:hypothetical protein